MSFELFFFCKHLVAHVTFKFGILMSGHVLIQILRVFVSVFTATQETLKHFVTYMLAPVLVHFACIDKVFATVCASVELGSVAVFVETQRAWCGKSFSVLGASKSNITVKYPVMGV